MFVKPILTVDVVCFTLIQGTLHTLLMKREKEPFNGQLALLGGYIHTEEDSSTMDAAKRVARDKLGLEVTYAEQLETFSGPLRDPRGWSASVVYIAVVRPSMVKETADFYPIGTTWTKNAEYNLAFDHNEILFQAVSRIRNKSTYSSLPLFLMDSTFTLTELQNVYEGMMQSPIDKATFRRKIIEQGIVEPSGEILDTKLHRPAKLYRATDKTIQLFKSTI
jgi:8-oxo-dGTP diphosphatase